MTFTSFPYLKDLNSGIDNALLSTQAMAAIRVHPKLEFILTEGRTLELVAESIYGNPHLWVILVDYNNIVNPLNPPEKIFYPPVSLLDQFTLI